MSHLNTIFGIVQKLCEDNPKVEELLKRGKLLEKENMLLESELDDTEREQRRLQIELFNMETTMDPINQLPEKSSVELMNTKVIENCTNIRFAISKIDFSKILQCDHMEKEQKLRKEWEQMQNYSHSLSQWYEKMEQRDVVKRYRAAEIKYKEAENSLERIRSSFEKSKQETRARMNAAKEKQYQLIVLLAQKYKEIQTLSQKFKNIKEYRRLKNKKIELEHRLAVAKNKRFGTLTPYKSSISTDASKSLPCTSVQATNKYMPKFPTFAEILKSFNQDVCKTEVKPEVTVIENTTNIMVKSILRNSQDNSMEINQSITTKHTKHVRFKVQLEEQFEFNDITDTVSDSSSSDSHDTTVAATPQSQIIIEEMEEPVISTEICIPKTSCNRVETEKITNQKEEKTNISPTKEKVNILECIVLRPPTLQDKKSYSDDRTKENIPPNVLGNHGTDKKVDSAINKNNDEKIMPPPQSPIVFKRSENFPKSFYEELLISSSVSSESDSESPSTSRKALKDLNTFMNFDISKEIKTDDDAKTFSNTLDFSLPQKKDISNEKNSSNAYEDFMDFDTGGGYGFGSNDDANSSFMDFL
ncbi:uncharacterized protein LOC142226489 [Haematobia irritans]|uniref:uncharacterized protein LOC142226489 n=1 Tax=Haematobia irritans TaxID=7368 RepID=UPI003F50085F